MVKDNLPVKAPDQTKPLWKDILTFSRRKYGWAALLVLIGLLGLIIPVIPGILLFVFAAALIKPGLMVKLRAKINTYSKKKNRNKKSPSGL